MTPSRGPFEISSESVAPGERRTIDLLVARLYTHAEVSMPGEVLHGERDGPTVFLSATLHGDEINGLEIVRRVLDTIDVASVSGTILAVPVVNVFGFIYQSRYLPDRRDLNRSFPGSSRGSQASRLAHLFWTEIVSKCQYGIDLHTAAPPRTNMPQVRADLSNEETRRCAVSFGAPLMMTSAGPPKSLRRCAVKNGIHLLVYEAGETRRFNSDAIDVGIEGVLRTLGAIGVMHASTPPARQPLEAVKTRWVRARQSGVFHSEVQTGDWVTRDQTIGRIGDPFGASTLTLKAPIDGLVIGHIVNPLVHRGEAVMHLAECRAPGE